MKLKRKLLIIVVINTPEFNRLTAENFAARLAQANLVTKINFDDKLKNFNKKVTQTKQNM